MKKFRLLAKYPILSVTAIGIFIFMAAPVILSLFIGLMIVVPIYLADQLLGSKE